MSVFGAPFGGGGGGGTAEVSAVDSFPGSPDSGDLILYTPSELMFGWTGSEWEALDVLGFWAEAVGELSVRDTVKLNSSGQALACAALTDTKCAGIIAAINGDDVFVVRTGKIGGFSGLTPGESLAVGESGGVAHPNFPSSWAAVLPVGEALTTTTVLVEIGEPMILTG